MEEHMQAKNHKKAKQKRMEEKEVKKKYKRTWNKGRKERKKRKTKKQREEREERERGGEKLVFGGSSYIKHAFQILSCRKVKGWIRWSLQTWRIFGVLLKVRHGNFCRILKIRRRNMGRSEITGFGSLDPPDFILIQRHVWTGVIRWVPF